MEGTKSFSHEQNGTALTSDLLVKMALNLSTHISHGRNQSSHHDRMAQPLHPTCSSEWLWISSTHIYDIVILDLDMLRLVMEHWIL